MLKVCRDDTYLGSGYFIADKKEEVIIKIIESGLYGAPEVDFFSMNQEVDQGNEECFRDIRLHVPENDQLCPTVSKLYESIRNKPLKSLNSKNNLVIEREKDGFTFVFKKDAYGVCKDECHIYLGDLCFCKSLPELLFFKNSLSKYANCEFGDIAYLLGFHLGSNTAKFPKLEVCGYENPNEEDSCIIADMNRNMYVKMDYKKADSLVSFTAHASDMETCKQEDGFTNIQINVRNDNQIFAHVNELFNCYRKISSKVASGDPSDGKNHFTMKTIREGIAFVFSRDMSLEGNPCECSINIPTNVFALYSINNREKIERQARLNNALGAFYSGSMRCRTCGIRDIHTPLGIDLPKGKNFE